MFCLAFVLFIVTAESYGQLTKVRGVVTDKASSEILPFVNIKFKNSGVGTISDFDGNYYLETRSSYDSVVVSYIGYKTITLPVIKYRFQTINFELESESFELGEVTIVPGENPAHIILDSIIQNKEANNPDNLLDYQYEVYNKIELDVNNISDSYKNKPVFKKFQFIFDYIDTSVVNGKTYLPMFISETLSEFHYQKSPKREKEIIRANRISGVQNTDAVSEYTGQMYLDINTYSNYIEVANKSFVSPIANFGKRYYRYYLVDSMYIDNQWCYQITFKPKRKQEPTFTGDFWAHDTTFAIKKVKVRIAEDANVNFILDLIAEHEYEYVNNENWFLKKENLFVDFNVADRTVGFFGRKTTSYSNVVINKPKEEDFFAKNENQQTITIDDGQEKDEDFWQEARHEPLTPKEQSIYAMVDSIKEVPLYRSIYDMVVTLVSGYYVKSYFEIGPYYSLSSFNAIEGNRFRLGGRSSNKFSTKLMLKGHVAYGLLDEKYKYGAGFMYMVSKEPRISFGVDYLYDMEQLGQSQNAFMSDNILSSMLSREYNRKLTMIEEYSAFFEKEWYAGFSNTISIKHKKVYATSHVPFIDYHTDIAHKNVTTAEINLNTRYAYNEKYILGEFTRTSLGTKYPILNLDLLIGPKNVFGSMFAYYKVHASIDHKFKINPFGEFRYVIDGGKYFGNTPYPFLQLHEGNETYAFDDYAFNMMNYYEFVSDQYVSLYAEHHFNGLFLNHVPLFRKLKWREVISGKGLIGNISNEDKILKYPDELNSLKEPYFEASVGVENIFKLLRFDLMWRLSYLDNPDIPKVGIRTKLQFVF